MFFIVQITIITGCRTQSIDEAVSGQNATTTQISTGHTSDECFTYSGSVTLDYAKNFTIDEYECGMKLISVPLTGQSLLLLPQGHDMPELLPENISDNVIILQTPISKTLVSTTPVMSLVNRVGALDKVPLTTYDVNEWYIDSVRAAMESGKLTFAGDYKALDFETLANLQPELSIFSTMIYDVPEVSAKLAELKIPVFIDYSTFENHPLGRTEWIKLYGALYGYEDEAAIAFDEQKNIVEGLNAGEIGDKTVSIFYISSKGNIYVRNSGDYIAKMVELAGGNGAGSFL